MDGFLAINIATNIFHAEQIFDQLDYCRASLDISFDVFCIAMLDDYKMLSAKMLNTAFGLFDVNGNGWVSLEELAIVLMAHGITSNPYDAPMLLRDFDLNKDGKIDLKEFRRVMGNPSKENPSFEIDNRPTEC